MSTANMVMAVLGLAGSAFISGWFSRSVYELVEEVRKEMAEENEKV